MCGGLACRIQGVQGGEEGGDIVYAVHLGSVLGGAQTHPHGGLVIPGQDIIQKTLAGKSDEDGEVAEAQRFQTIDQLEVLLGRLTEPDAGV